MKGKKLAGILSIGLSCALLFTGCSFSGAMDRLVGSVTETGREAVVASSSEDGEVVATKKFDASLAVPTFDQDLGGVANVTVGGTVTLQASASVTDGGTVTYQWYMNKVESNGGGTRIDGAVDAIYMPSTAEGGTTFYYVVAINDHGETINEATSSTQAVTVWANMYWQQNADNGGYQYLNHDNGSFPSNCSMEVDGVTYTFNENGFAINPDTGEFVNITTGETVSTVEEAQEPEETPEPEQAETEPVEATSVTEEAPSEE